MTPTRPTRRQLLQVGGAGLFGLSLPGLLAAAECGSGRKGGEGGSLHIDQSGEDLRPIVPGYTTTSRSRTGP